MGKKSARYIAMTDLDTSKLLALKLSSLNETDFNWIYSHLQDDIKDDLDPIIREIKEIGFEIDSNTISTLVQKNEKHERKILRDKDIQILDSSSYSDIAEVFKLESNLLFNTLISIGPWKWEKETSYIDKPKTSSTKCIKNIKSKNLLEKSIISTTSSFLQDAEKVLSKNKETSQFQYISALTHYFNKLIRPTIKWKF